MKTLHLKLGKNLYLTAVKARNDELVFSLLKEINEMLKNREIQSQFLKMKVVEASDLLKIFQEVLPEKTPELVLNLMVIVVKNKLGNKFNGIFNSFKKEFLKNSGRSEIKIVTAREFSESEKKNFSKIVMEKFDGKAEIEFYKDENLIGGMQVFRDGNLTDMSIRAQLNNLKNILIN